nr:LysM peptidoglycan-binding domain-containing protein [Niveispirillum sp. SYP-B3756]
MAGNRAVVVVPGNNLWTIARRSYGEGPRYTMIFEANQGQIRDPDLIYPGQIFMMPDEK